MSFLYIKRHQKNTQAKLFEKNLHYVSTGRKADFGKIHTFPLCFFGIFWLSRLTCISDTRLSDKNDSQGDGGDSSGGSWVGSLHLELIVIGNGDLAAPKLGWILLWCVDCGAHMGCIVKRIIFG